MRRFLLATGFYLVCLAVSAQNFEIASLEDSYKGSIGEVIHAPLSIKNISDRPITIILKKVETQIGSTQKNFFCPDNNCIDQRTETYTIKLEPGETLNNFSIGLEAGLTEGLSSVKYSIHNKSNPTEIAQLDLNFAVEAKREKSNIYTSRFITLHDIYPNPVITSATIDYNISDGQLKAKIIVHNILGSPISVYELSPSQNTVKIDAESLNTGIYFYTLYVNNEGVMTRKLMVKK